jgi:ABC-type phosphate/phosphonate transport system permease subunit
MQQVASVVLAMLVLVVIVDATSYLARQKMTS